MLHNFSIFADEGNINYFAELVHASRGLPAVARYIKQTPAVKAAIGVDPDVETSYFRACFCGQGIASLFGRVDDTAE